MNSSAQLIAHLQKIASGEMGAATSAQPAIYWDTDIAALETTQIFQQDWVCPGLAAEIPNTGDYLTYSIAGSPVFCIRDKPGDIRTFSNVCRHRMMKLLEGSGQTNRVVCPYHAWTYDLNGQLIGAGHMEKSTDFDVSKICLPEIRTEIWNGWIYITLNPDATPVATALSDLQDVISRYQMQNYVPVVKEEHVWKTNWKLLCENFMESYHLPVAHKATVGAWIGLEDSGFPAKSHDAFTYQTFTKQADATYGTAHPDNTTLKDEWRHTSVMPSVFPAHMFVLAPDHVWYLTLRPRGVGAVDVRFGVAIAPEVDAALGTGEDRAAWVKELVSFFEHVNEEDRHMVEGIFIGSKSLHAAPGRLSWLEREIHDFQKYLARRLSAEVIGDDT
jgi:choline monooxygenase